MDKIENVKVSFCTAKKDKIMTKVDVDICKPVDRLKR